jgi:hypothetical protein
VSLQKHNQFGATETAQRERKLPLLPDHTKTLHPPQIYGFTRETQAIKENEKRVHKERKGVTALPLPLS